MAIPFTTAVGSQSITATEFSFPNASTTLAPQTTACKLEVWLDLSGMVAGDQIRIRVYEKVNAGTQAVAWEGFATGAQSQLYMVPPRSVTEGWDVTAKLIAGSASTVRWSLREDVGDRNALTIGANAITAAAAAVDFGTEIAAAVASALTIPSAGTVAAAVWAAVAEGSETFGDAVRLVTARLFGKATVQDADGAYAFRNLADTKDRIAGARSGTARTVTTRDGT